jgi:hypothetical protein
MRTTLTESNVPAGTTGSSSQAIDFWVAKISKALGYSAGWLVQTGQQLIEAKKALGHGGWLQLFEPGRLRFSVRTAEMLMKIARHPSMRNSQNLSFLPSSSTTLYELARADERTIQQGIAEGSITPQMSLKEARALVRSPEGVKSVGPGAFDAAKRTEILNRRILAETMKWPPQTRTQLADALDSLARRIRAGAAPQLPPGP